MKYLSKILLLSSLAVLMAVGSASATEVYLSFSTGTEYVQIKDNNAGDTDSTVGIVSWTGSVESWSVAVTGTSNPELGSWSSPAMDVNAVATGGSGYLGVAFSVTDFANIFGSNTSYQMDFAGTSDGGVLYSGFWDPGNVEFAPTTALWTNGPFPPGDYDGQIGPGSNMDLNGVTFYSMTMFGEFTPGSSVPEPATMLLLGSGLIGLVGFRRKFKK